MTRRALVFLSLVGLAACSGEPSQPSDAAGGPAFAIVDASDAGGRLDFGWRPPIANTSIGGTFDADRHPTVRICSLEENLDGCDGDYELTVPNVPVVAGNYHFAWTVPTPTTIPASGVQYYRILVEAGDPAVLLGFAHVKAAASSKGTKPNDPNEFVAITFGSILPIKFRINTFCATNDCGGGFIDTNVGGTSYFTDEDGVVVGGVTIEANPGGGLVTVEIKPCIGDLPIPNRKFGSCLDVLAEDEGGEEYVGPGVAFICDALEDADDLSAEEKELVALYRKHGSEAPHALRNVAGKCPYEELASGSVKGLLRALVHGNWKKAGQQLTGLLAPKPLYARRLDAGAGGEVDGGFSLFQFALRPGRVLIYGPTMSAPTTGLPDNEQTLADAAGFLVTVADAATWSGLTSGDFGLYKAIVFGDPTCSSNPAILNAADANKAVWSAVATGPAVVIGTDPQFHSFAKPEAKQLITNGITYAASGAATGLYVSLSCYYFTAPVNTQVTFLSAIGDFRVEGQGETANTVTIVDAGHAVMSGLTSAGLSGWDNSVHAFFAGLSSFPGAFHPLANGVLNGVSVPYIIAR